MSVDLDALKAACDEQAPVSLHTLRALIAEVERLRAEKAEMQDALRGVMGAVPVTDVQVAFTGDYGLYVRSVFARLEKERDGWMDSAYMYKHTVNDLDALVTTLRFALTPEGGHEGWRPPRGIDPLVDLALDVREAKEKAEANYAFMVERAANEKLDGYRELGAKAAAAENERNALRERLRETAQILIEAVGADGPTNAEDAARMAVTRMERLRELADEKAHEAGLYARRMAEAQEARRKAREEERAAVVAWLRDDPDWPWCAACRDASLYEHADAIERGEHRHEEKADER